MDVLIGWSKNKSKQLARHLCDWLPSVLPGIKPWMSQKDIDKGTEWFGELQAYLGEARHCVVVITEENVRSPWLYYEAGAIAVKGEGVRICPYLVGVEPGILADGPLGRFQCTEATAEETLALVYSLNKAAGGLHNEQLLAHAFELKWPVLEAEIGRVAAIPAQDVATFIRSDADLIAGDSLSTEAATLLLEASQDRQGVIIFDEQDLAGTTVGTNGKTLNQQGDPRSEAEWKQALDDLLRLELVEQQGEVSFVLTAKGYRVADKLKESSKVVSKELDENDIISLLEGHLATQRDKLSSLTFRFDEMEAQLRLPPGSAEKHIEKAAETLGHKIRRKGSNVVTFDKDPKRRSLSEMAAEANQRRVYRS